MLALSRTEGQSVHLSIPGLAKPVVVHVVRWTRSKVRLAIEAPREVRIDRSEILDHTTNLEPVHPLEGMVVVGIYDTLGLMIDSAEEPPVGLKRDDNVGEPRCPKPSEVS